MLGVTCRSWGRLRGVVILTPWCVGAVVGSHADIFVETDWDSGRLPVPPGRDSALACGCLWKQKVKCFKNWVSVSQMEGDMTPHTYLSKLLLSSVWCGWRTPRRRRPAWPASSWPSSRTPPRRDSARCDRAWRHCLQPLNCRPVDL